MYDLLFLGGYLYGKRDTTAMLQATFVLSDIGPLCMQLYGPQYQEEDPEELEKDLLDCVRHRLDPGTTALDGYTLAVSTRLPRLLHR